MPSLLTPLVALTKQANLTFDITDKKNLPYKSIPSYLSPSTHASPPLSSTHTPLKSVMQPTTPIRWLTQGRKHIGE